MTSQKHTPAEGGRATTRTLFVRILPALVVFLTLGVIAWSAWPTLRPVRSVEVTQVIFDPSAPIPAAQPDAGAPRASGASGAVVQAAGWLEAEPFHIACTSLVDGVVESIHVLEGDYAEKDDLVAQLVREDEELRLRAAEAAVLTAEGELASARADLAAALASFEDPVELERRIEAARAEVQAARGELTQLPMLIGAARARLERLEAERKWTQITETGGAATELELVVATQNVEAARNEFSAVEARQAIIEARLARHRADLRAAERDLELRIADTRAVEVSRAERARAEAALALAETKRDEAALALERTTIRAPISGYVERRLKIPGDKVMRMMDAPHSAHIVHMYDPERLQVRVDVPLADAANVRKGQACEVVVDVLPNRTFRGEVLRITHEADLQKNTLEVKVKVFDPDPLLRPEMLTRVKFLNREAGDDARFEQPQEFAQESGLAMSVLVSEGSIDRTETGDRVWALVDRRGTRGTLRAVPVNTLGESDGYARVRGKLQPGALLAVVDEGFRDGLPIEVRTSATEGDS